MRFKARFVGKFLFVLAAVAVLGGAVMQLWNLVVPGLFTGAHTIDYWHALGLLLLSRILFGGFHGHRGKHDHRHWQKWAAMTEEEREQLRKNKCNFGSRNGEQA